MSVWAVWCDESERAAVARVAMSLEAHASLVFAGGPDDLRGMVARGEPGELAALVGPAEGGVSDVNLAAALVADGHARRVVLASREVSGSLRSRAARAGVDLVVDLREAGMPGAGGEGGERGDGGRPPIGPEPSAPVQPGAVEGRPGGSAPLGRGAAPVMVLCSGRGGVGKTAVATALAVAGARWGLRVALLDLDLSCGNAYACFGLAEGSDLARLASGDGPEHLLVDAAPGVRVAGPCARPETAEVVMPHVARLVSYARSAHDLVIVDTSSTFTDAVAQAAQSADRLLLVSDARVGSVASTARMSGLAVRLGVARTRIARLENRSDPRERPGPVAGRAEVGLEAARVFRVVEGGGEVVDLLASGRVAELVEPGYPFADSVETALAQLLVELGRLPECEEARRAAQGPPARRWLGLLGARREAR